MRWRDEERLPPEIARLARNTVRRMPQQPAKKKLEQRRQWIASVLHDWFLRMK